MAVAGATFGVVGVLAAFPRRLAALEVSRQGGQLRRGLTRKTTDLVFGRKLLEQRTPTEIEDCVAVARASGARALSENAFLEGLGLRTPSERGTITTASLLQQSKLTVPVLELLSLFDAFEHATEPYSFRDLILARKYAGLIAAGADWLNIARAVHRADSIPSLTALTLQVDQSGAVVVALGRGLSELDGQRVLDLVGTEQPDPDALFYEAEEAREQGNFSEAARLYGLCLAIDPSDAVTAYDRGNALTSAGELDLAAHAFALAIKLDPQFVEAWFNLACVMRDRGRIEAACQHLYHAIDLDPDYADAVYNLATLEFGAERLAEARSWWVRYLELDQTSEWAVRAQRGIHYIDRLATSGPLGKRA